MSQFQIIIDQITILGILIVIGFIGSKIKIITVEVSDSIAKLIIKITMPLLILTSLSSLTLEGDMLKNGLMVLIFSYVGLFLLMGAGLGSAKFLRLKPKSAHVHSIHTVFGNNVFLGFPLFQALYPDGKGIFFATIFYIASDSLLWTWGVYLLGNHDKTQKTNGLKHLINPNTICFVIGILMFILKIRFPTVIHSSLSGLGHTTIYLSMLYIGAVLAGIRLQGILKKYSVYVLSLIKLLIIPLALIFILNLLERYAGIGLSLEAKNVLVLQTGMPCMATCVVLAKNAGSDDVLAAENVFISTILSIASIPFVLYLIEII